MTQKLPHHWGRSIPDVPQLGNLGAIALCMAASLPLAGCPRDITRPRTASATSQQPTNNYGASGSITTDEAIAVRGLIAPGTQPDSSGVLPFAQRQSREAITSRIGYAATEETTYGRYTTDGNPIDVVYDSQGYAIGVRKSK